MYGKANAFAQFLGEALHFFRLNALRAAHPQGEADHDFSHFVIAHQLAQLLKIQAFVLSLQRLQTLRREAERIRDRDANALRAHVESKNALDGLVRGARSDLPSSLRLYVAPEFQIFDYDTGMSEEVEVASAPVRTPPRDWAQRVIAIGVVLTICYVAELVLVVILLATLLAFILAPIVDFLGRFRLPRSLSSLIAVMTLLALAYGLTYISYNEAADFVQVLPKYSERIRSDRNEGARTCRIAEPASAGN